MVLSWFLFKNVQKGSNKNCIQVSERTITAEIKEPRSGEIHEVLHIPLPHIDAPQLSFLSLSRGLFVFGLMRQTRVLLRVQFSARLSSQLTAESMAGA